MEKVQSKNGVKDSPGYLRYHSGDQNELTRRRMPVLSGFGSNAGSES
jgi:hypothetical protein